MQKQIRIIITLKDEFGFQVSNMTTKLLIQYQAEDECFSRNSERYVKDKENQDMSEKVIIVIVQYVKL